MPAPKITQHRSILMRPGSLTKVGVVTHVSCIDRRPGAKGTSRPAPYAQLEAYALSRLESLCALLGSRPVRVMAHCEDTTSEVFLELANGVQIQYFGSLQASRGEQRLWVEGPPGSLLHEGVVLWWRKRGWPKFLPWGFACFAGKGTQGKDGALFEAIRQANEKGRVVSLGA